MDKVVWVGTGLRWAAMGQHMLFHLGAGPGGLLEFCSRYRDSFHRWWDDLDEVQLTPELAQALYAGVEAESNQQSTSALSAQRDALIVEFLRGRSRLQT